MPALFQSQLLMRARVELGLTQEEAARAVGVDVRTYRRYESGEVNVGGSFEAQRASRRKILDRLCREFGLDEGNLVCSTELLGRPSTTLPSTAHFVGRSEELARLQAWFLDGTSTTRVMAIVALGGAGKTSLIARALAEHGAFETAPFVFSFYEHPSVDAFLAAAAVHLLQTGSDAVDDVLAGLRQQPSQLLVLDGLEVVQEDGEGERARGELSDRRLVRLLRAVVRDRALGRILVTSRFALSDLAAFEGRELSTISLPHLTLPETQSLFGQLGLIASEATLNAVYTHTAGHALSLAVVGAYAAEMLQGDLALAIGLELSDAARDQPLARKLQLMLDRYAAELSELERTLLGCVCIYPRGVTPEQLMRLGALDAATELGVRAGLGRLVRRGLLVFLGERYSAHPFVRGHFAALVGAATTIHAHERARLNSELEAQPTHRLQGSQLDQGEQLFEHTLAVGDVHGAYRVLRRTLGGFSHLGLRLGEFERGLRLVRALEPELGRLPADDQWRVVYDRGLYAGALGDLDTAERAYRALLARNDEDATTHRTLGYTLRLRGAYELAHEHIERSIELGRREQAAGMIARGLALRGALLTSQGRIDEAQTTFHEVRALGDVPTGRRAIWEAELCLALGDADQATTLTLANLEDCKHKEWAGHVAHCHVILGHALLLRGALDDAEHALDAAFDWCRRSKEVELTLESQFLELVLAKANADTERAARVGGTLLDAALAGGYGSFVARLQSANT